MHKCRLTGYDITVYTKCDTRNMKIKKWIGVWVVQLMNLENTNISEPSVPEKRFNETGISIEK
jgi:hypothetical protein